MPGRNGSARPWPVQSPRNPTHHGHHPPPTMRSTPRMPRRRQPGPRASPAPCPAPIARVGGEGWTQVRPQIRHGHPPFLTALTVRALAGGQEQGPNADLRQAQFARELGVTPHHPLRGGGEPAEGDRARQPPAVLRPSPAGSRHHPESRLLAVERGHQGGDGRLAGSSLRDVDQPHLGASHHRQLVTQPLKRRPCQRLGHDIPVTGVQIVPQRPRHLRALLRSSPILLHPSRQPDHLPSMGVCPAMPLST